MSSALAMRHVSAPSGAAEAHLIRGTPRAVAELAIVPRQPVRNRLLAALPPDDYDRIRPYLEPVYFEQRQTLFEQEEAIRHVYFPETMVVSLVSTLRDGVAVEVGTAGCEGMAGLPLFLADDSSSVWAFAQIPGNAVRIEADTFTRLASAPGMFHRMLLRYTQAFLTQVAQTAACNGSHPVDQRCARWLLMTHDRVAGTQFQLTHEFLAFMLGVRRAGVSVAMRKLQDARLVSYARGKITILDREGIEKASCECYTKVRAHFDRLLPSQG